MVRIRYIPAIIFLFFSAFINAQTDNLFWFAAPDVSSDHGNDPKNGAPIYMHFTAITATTVTISQPANPTFTPITFSLDEMEHYTLQLDAIMSINQIENYPLNLPTTQNKAFKVTSSPGDITVYYELDNYYNRDIFPLKGKNALGKLFYVSTQNYFSNGDYAGTAYSGFVIAATEDNTTVKVYPNDDMLYFDTNPGDVITITLDAGETFAFRAEDRPANRHINGVRVESDNDIAITWYDDSIRKKNTNTTDCGANISYDICGDQLIPVELIGNEYIVMKGQIINSTSCDGGERIFITSTQPNTQVYIDGALVTTLANAGMVYNYEINNPILHVETSQPVYINHTTGFGGELGGAVLPTIEGCTGSYDVTFTRSPQTLDKFFLNIMVRNDTATGSPRKNQSIKNFTITSGGVISVIPESYFDYILDSTWVVLKKTIVVEDYIMEKIEAGDEARVSNSIARFHLGVINGGTSTGCKYGYFSDYKSDVTNAGIGGANGSEQGIFCNLDPIHLVASGGKSYKWYGHLNANDTLNLSSTTVADPYFSPVNAGYYVFRVNIERECFADTSIYMGLYVMAGPKALFEVSKVEGCSPLSIKFTNNTDESKADQNYWNFNTKYNTVVQQSSLTNPFYHQFPINYTDTIQKYNVRLTVKGPFGECPDQSEQLIKILPNIDAGFTADTNMGCSPLLVHFQDTSAGYIDTLNSYWDFGTYHEPYKASTQFTFVNNHSVDTIIKVRLIAFTTFGCSDTATYSITVHPNLNATFSANNLTKCSPLITTIDPFGSVGVKTFYWRIHDLSGVIIDSAFTRTNPNSFVYSHYDVTQPDPDTVFVEMYGVNQYGCSDTAITKKLITYPEVHAAFLKTDDEICDSVSISFTNNSIGYRLLNEWDLGDGTYLTDTTGLGFNHTFYNRTGSSKEYIVKLFVTSDYFCTDSITDTIKVYPFVNANFAIDYNNNCSPLLAEISNTSVGGSTFDWDFGDGNLMTSFVKNTFNHTYINNSNHDTTYYLKLNVTNLQGCKDSIKRSVSLFSQVVADFNFTSPNQGCNPLSVSFLNSSKGANLEYSWDLGDKTYSKSLNPLPKVYKNATAKDTTYYVTLTVMNLAGCDSSLTRTVEVFSKVTADFSIERLDSCSPFKIIVDNNSSGGISEFVWQYTPTETITLYDFSDPDIPVYRNQTLLPVDYPIVLTAQNVHGCSATKSSTITVFPEVHAVFTPDINAGCQPLPVSFVNSTNITGGTTFFWDFDDGRYANLVTPPEHIFGNLTSLTKVHDIHLEATSQYGCFDDTTITVEVYPYIYAQFAIDRSSICSHEAFTIDRTSSNGAIDHYYWDYEDDGTYDEDKNTDIFNYSYSNTSSSNATHNIRLTVTNPQGCDTSWTESMTVHPQVRAAFDIDKDEVCYPHTSSFSNLSQPAIPLTYDWDFGDGSGSSVPNPVHAYKNFSKTNNASFTIFLTAVSEYGCDSTISKDFVVHPKPLADFKFPSGIDCPPFTVLFENNSQGLNLDYLWDFDNGTTSSDQDPSQTFYNEGSSTDERDISLIITTEYGCADTAIKPISVFPNVVVDFDASVWNGCNPLTVDLNGTATNENEYYWYVDEDVFSNYQDPSYRFVNESVADKIFNVRFKAVSINGCTAETIKQVVVYPKPLAEFLPNPQVMDFNTLTDITSVTINNLTDNHTNWIYHWDFGDGSTSDQSGASYIKEYTIWGDIANDSKIPISMIAANASHDACADTIMHYIVINPPLPRVDLGPDVSGCMPLTVEFPSSTKYNYKDYYAWDFGYEGMGSADDEPSPLVYDTAGVYIVRLVVKGDGGSNWDYKTITVYPKPIVNFSFTPDYAWLRSQNEDGTPIKFFNTTIEGLNYLWDFGDGESTSEFQPQHEYMSVGTYYVTLVAESGLGCYDTLMHETPIVIDGRGKLEFPNVITIVPGAPAEEYYNPGVPDPNIFRPVAEGIEEYKLEIYNRWGELLFVSEEVDKGWNGYIKDSPAKQDVYVWRVTARFTNGRPYVKAGDVTVLVREP